MERSPLISIIIVSFNSKKWLKKCLDSLYCQTFRDLEIVIIDNNSSDGSVDFIGLEYPQAKLIKLKKNLGFAGGVNIGVRNSSAEYVLLFNPDAWLESDFLEKLLEFYQKNDFDVVGPLEAEYDSPKIKNRNFVSKIDPFGFSVLVDKDETKNHQQFNLCGFCLFFKKDLYLKTGGLDNDFFMYIEEIDWFWRLALLDKKVGLADHLSAYHAGIPTEAGIRLNQSVFLWRNQNILQMMLKNYSLPSLFFILPAYFLQNLLEIAILILALRFRIAFTYPRGWWFNVKNFAKILKKRKQIQEARVVGDCEFFAKHGYWGIGKLQLFFKLAHNRKKK